jgi:hypothetical protein
MGVKKIRVEICIPVTLDVCAQLDDDGEDFDIKDAQLAAFQDITVRKLQENMDDYTADYILEKLKEK